MKITLKGDLIRFLQDLIDEGIITLEELNSYVAGLNQENAKKHYSSWVAEKYNIYHCLRCGSIIYHPEESELPVTCPGCGAQMVKPMKG